MTEPEGLRPAEPRGEGRSEGLAVLLRHGLRFSDVVHALAQRQSTREQAYIAAARQLWHEEGTLEIDDESIVSGSDDDGDYVLAWVWISDEAAGLPTPDNADAGHGTEQEQPGEDQDNIPAAREHASPAPGPASSPAASPTRAPRRPGPERPR